MTRPKPPQAAQATLFGGARRRPTLDSGAPLADRMRPRTLEELVGQPDVSASGKLLGEALTSDRIPSLILWGPPGSGKTSLAHIVAERTRSEFVALSAVLSGVKDIRAVIDAARERRDFESRGTILFVDEIHRFNKAQQDAFLPHVEAGTITLIGATTEHPSFAVNAAVLSRCRVVRLEPLDDASLVLLLTRALADSERGLGGQRLRATREALSAIARAAAGDARRALGTLEAAALLAPDGTEIDLATVERAAEQATLLYDRAGEEHYNVTSAFIKSLRGTDPDAALYYMFRMLDAGEDPLFVLRRLMIFASEDIGNADPRALLVATSADQAFQRMGMPEGVFPLAHACVYLASAPKSDAVKRAIGRARAAVNEHGAVPVPKKLRNAVTALMKQDGYAADYRYPHDYSGAVAEGETYLPEALLGERFYEPTEHGFEKTIAERLARIRDRAR